MIINQRFDYGRIHNDFSPTSATPASDVFTNYDNFDVRLMPTWGNGVPLGVAAH
jgi:hypothetical protein